MLLINNKKASPYSITERRVPELIPVLGSQPAGDVSRKPDGRLPLLSARPAVKRAATNFAAWWTEARRVWTVCLRLLPDSDAAAGPSAPESSTLTTRLLWAFYMAAVHVLHVCVCRDGDDGRPTTLLLVVHGVGFQPITVTLHTPRDWWAWHCRGVGVFSFSLVFAI